MERKGWIPKLAIAGLAAVGVALVVVAVVTSGDGSPGSRTGDTAPTSQAGDVDPETASLRTLMLRADANGDISTVGGPLHATLMEGSMPGGPTMATVLTDENCEPDAQGISHCRNELELADGTRLVVRHDHRMHEVPCLTPGEQLAVQPA